MRNFIATLFCACLLAPASFAQQERIDPQSPDTATELTLPDELVRDLRDIAAAAKRPPRPMDLQLPENVRGDLSVIASDVSVIAADIRAKLDEKNARERIPDDADVWWWTGRFLERWFWLIGFALLAGSSALSGRRDSKHAVYLESQTRDVRSYRDLIRDGRVKAEAEGKPQPEAEGNEPGKTDLGGLIRSTRNYIEANKKRGPLPKIIFWLGALMLVGLAGLPNNVFGMSLTGAKTSAAEIFGSPSATAFAGAWLALIYFASSQSQRRTEAEHDFTVVSDEAASIANAKKSAAYEKYERAFDRIGDWRGSAPNVQSDDDASNAADLSKYRLVEEAARRLAQGDKLLPTDDEDKFVAATDRFTRLLRPPFFAELTLGNFVQNLLRERELITEHRNEWDLLARTYGGNDRARWEGIRSLAEILKR